MIVMPELTVQNVGHDAKFGRIVTPDHDGSFATILASWATANPDHLGDGSPRAADLAKPNTEPTETRAEDTAAELEALAQELLAQDQSPIAAPTEPPKTRSAIDAPGGSELTRQGHAPDLVRSPEAAPDIERPDTHSIAPDTTRVPVSAFIAAGPALQAGVAAMQILAAQEPGAADPGPGPGPGQHPRAISADSGLHLIPWQHTADAPPPLDPAPAPFAEMRDAARPISAIGIPTSIAPPSGPPVYLVQIIGALQGGAVAGQGTFELALSPEELGSVRMVFNTIDGALAVQIAAERPETAELLRRNSELLLRDLQDAGHVYVNLSFSSGEQNGGAPSAQGEKNESSDQPAIAHMRTEPAYPTPERQTGRLDLRL